MRLIRVRVEDYSEALKRRSRIEGFEKEGFVGCVTITFPKSPIFLLKSGQN